MLSKLSPKVMGNLENWKKEDILNTPQQKGGYDCGVFCLTFARYVLEERPFPFQFEQKHVPFLRRKIAFDLLTSKYPKINQVNL